MLRGIIVLALAGIPVMGLVGCSTEPQTHSQRMDLKSEADRAVADAQRIDPTLRDFMARSAGYAVLPATGEGGLVVGGGYGKGVLYEHGVMTGYCDLAPATAGAQTSGPKITEIICFETPDRMNQFKSGQYTLSNDVIAIVLGSGAAAFIRYQDNIAVFVTGPADQLAETTVGGQQFRFTLAGSPNSTARPAGEQIPGGNGESGTGNNSSGTDNVDSLR